MIGGELLAVLLVAGQGVAAIELLVGARRLGVGRTSAACLPIGLVVHAALALPLRLAGFPASCGMAALQAGGLALAALVVARLRPPHLREERRSRWRAAEIALAALIVGVLLALGVAAALEPPVEWDLLAIWGWKAKTLAAGGAWLHELRDPAFAYAHPDYPLAWPLALALEPAITGRAPRGGSGLLGVAMLASAGGFAAALLRPRGRRAALAGACLVALLPLAGAQAVRGQADLPLATLFLVAAGCLAEWTLLGDGAALILGAVATAGLGIVKQEGMALAVAIAATVFFRAGAGRRLRLASALGAAFLVVDLPWLMLRLTLPAGAANSFADMTPQRALAGFARLPEILAAIPLYLGAVADWAVLWVLVALALAVLAFDRARSRQETELALLLVAPLPLYLLALQGVNWETARLMEVTLARLALHFAPLATVVSMAVAAKYGAFGDDPT